MEEVSLKILDLLSGKRLQKIQVWVHLFEIYLYKLAMLYTITIWKPKDLQSIYSVQGLQSLYSAPVTILIA